MRHKEGCKWRRVPRTSLAIAHCKPCPLGGHARTPDPHTPLSHLATIQCRSGRRSVRTWNILLCMPCRAADHRSTAAEVNLAAIILAERRCEMALQRGDMAVSHEGRGGGHLEGSHCGV